MRGRALLVSLVLSAAFLRAEDPPGNRFIYTVVRHGGTWEPYGDLWPQISESLSVTTSLRPWPVRRAVAWEDPGLFESPFLVLTGRGPADLPEEALARLRDFLMGGGFLLVDSAEGEGGGFARSAAALPARLFPGTAWRPVPADHAVFRAFFLLKEAAGRRRSDGVLKGLWVGDRLAAAYSPDDLHGAWVRAPAGGWLFPCEPGGEPQRILAQRLLINLVMYSVTGTYKTDAIHQEYLQRKLEEP